MDQKLKALRLSHVLAAGFGLVLVLLLVISGTSLWSLEQVTSQMRSTAKTQATRLDVLRSMRDSANQVYTALLGTVIAGPDDIDYELERFQEARKQHDSLYKQFQGLAKQEGALSKDTEKAFANIDTATRNVYSMSDSLMARLKEDPEGTNRRGVASMVTNTIGGHSFNWLEAIRLLTAQQIKHGEIANQAAEAQVVRARVQTMVIAAVAVLAGIATALLISRGVGKSIQGAVGFAQRVASGDLNVKPPAVNGAEAQQLFNALGEMQSSLRRLVHDIRQCAMNIEVASTEVASGNQDLSRRTEETSARLQETATLMHDITSNVQHNTESAASANALASNASHTATKGGEVMQQVVTNMSEIASSSQKISDIIGVIDGIAFQTNILALNAAVEAASAGEQGRGFSVVASEVRTLSQRVANAAKEIKTLIGASVERVETGASNVNQAGATMHNIVDAVQRVGAINAEISEASQAQREAIAAVSQAVSMVDNMTQQNAALVEQSTAAAESLRSQAQALTQLVRVFQIDESAELA